MPGVVFRRKSGGNSSAGCVSSSLHAGGATTLRTEPQLIVRRLAHHSRSVEHLPRASEAGATLSNGGSNAGDAYSTSASGSSKHSHFFAAIFDGWSNGQIRCVLGAVMILSFSFLISCGHLVITLMTVVIQTAVFGEVINVAYLRYRERRLAWFRTLNW